MRLTIAASLALALVFGVPTALAGPGDDCETYRAASVPLLHPPLNAGHVEVCDEDRDGAADTIHLETNQVPSSNSAQVTNQEKQRSHQEDEQTEADLKLAPSNFAKPKVRQWTFAEDEGNDGQLNTIFSNGGLYTSYGQVSYFLLVMDNDDDPSPDVYGVAACAGTTCEFAGTHLVPQIPDRIPLPSTIVYLEPVGYVP